VLDLLLDPLKETTAHKAPKVTQNMQLPPIRLARPIGIHFQIKASRLTCLFCQWNCQQRPNRKCQAITKILNHSFQIELKLLVGIAECFCVLIALSLRPLILDILAPWQSWHLSRAPKMVEYQNNFILTMCSLKL
jgi:hypothetical protein